MHNILYTVVKFNFSRADFSIREDEDLPSQLSIVKTGQIEPNISFQVYVYPVEEGPDETGNKLLTVCLYSMKNYYYDVARLFW